MSYHTPAMLKETLDGLLVENEGVFVDVTYGGGGHTAAMLDRLSENSKVLAFDQDPDAERNLIDDDRLLFVNQNFQYLKQFLKLYKLIPVDGILADLGVSFHQFDQAERGFSFRFEGPLDMRMDKKRSLTAARVLNEYDLADLTHLLRNYGELRNASKVAYAIVGFREEQTFETIAHLKAAVAKFSPQHKQHKFFAQLFQAIRIEVNEEMKVLELFLEQAAEVLKPGGRLAIITYHSLEDRLVKNFIRSGNTKGEVEKDFYGNLIRPLEPLTSKPIQPEQKEIEVNNRARSAKLRLAEKSISNEQ
ncbi:MAG: 16S rRNA (cytosine(1402)-N(4))-methyltransferase [Verrucomicrobia bacterium]|nr:16S rRNA (cytosine(1402)-N(4))-methyltransferase [Verrucomicrobiota bacterium]